MTLSIKGIAYSTVAIAALMGILGVSIWSYAQLSSGSRLTGTVTQRQNEDVAISKLENAKGFISQDLKFASYDSSLEVAKQGGTIYPVTYWYCNGNPTPPSQNEVNFAVSDKSTNFLNAYMDTLSSSDLSKLGISVSKYDCVGVNDPGSDACTQKDPKTCETFGTSAQQGTIQVSNPATTSFAGNINSDNNGNRFYRIYYMMYKDTTDQNLLKVIGQQMRATCALRNSDVSRLDLALAKTCDYYENLFADPDGNKYVKCKIETVCGGAVACTNTQCERPKLTQNLCWESSKQAPYQGATVQDILGSLSGQAVNAQTFGQRVLKITLTDTKYNIPSSKGVNPLVWNFYAAIEPPNPPCRPIDGG